MRYYLYTPKTPNALRTGPAYMVGTLSEQPSAGLVAGDHYFATDTGALYVATGPTTWVQLAASSVSPSSTVAGETTFGISAAAGVAPAYSRGDHTHGTPADPVPTHAALTASVHGFDSGGNAPAQAHALGGAKHSADTLANLNAAISDADVPALAGQIGGTAASPDIRGLRETGGPTMLTLGAVPDGQYLKRSGANVVGATVSAYTAPAWKGVVAAAWGDGNPELALAQMQTAGVVSPTPTNITVSVARCAYFKLDTALTVAKIRWYGVGSTTGLYHVAVYNAATLARVAILDDFNTAAATWGSGAFSASLAAGTLYILAVSVDTTGTTAGVLALGPTPAATTGQMTRGTGWAGSLDFDAVSPIIAPFGFCQFAVTNGALPNPANALADVASWTGGMPAFFLDSNNAA